ncbi:MAG: outer membrane lipid asymmetry maintenance protein MlaD [Thermodesulforhabdaceae bacterium]|jgi:phospholipid/cholesterol/gamma-HCH transport system substrate-binding protein
MTVRERNYKSIEIMVGFFILLGILAMGYVSLKLGKIGILNRDEYIVYATFSNVSGLKKKAPVTMSGVEIGRVENITLNGSGRAKVALVINKNVKLSEDCIASIKTMGIIGDKYIAISQGGLDSYIQPGGEITDTLPPLDVEELISKFVFGKVEGNRQKDAEKSE